MDTIILYEIPVPDWSDKMTDHTFRNDNDNTVVSLSRNLDLIVPSVDGMSLMYTILSVEEDPIKIITRQHEYEIRPTSQGWRLNDFRLTMHNLGDSIRRLRSREAAGVNPQGFKELGNPTLW